MEIQVKNIKKTVNNYLQQKGKKYRKNNGFKNFSDCWMIIFYSNHQIVTEQIIILYMEKLFLWLFIQSHIKSKINFESSKKKDLKNISCNINYVNQWMM